MWVWCHRLFVRVVSLFGYDAVWAAFWLVEISQEAIWLCWYLVVVELRVWAWRWLQPRRQVSYENSHRWGYSGPFWGTFSKIRLNVHYMRSKDCDGSRFFRGAFMGGNNFVFNPEANSLLFREFLPWLKQHHCMMTRKLRKSNNSWTFITDHDENSFNQQQQ